MTNSTTLKLCFTNIDITHPPIQRGACLDTNFAARYKLKRFPQHFSGYAQSNGNISLKQRSIAYFFVTFTLWGHNGQVSCSLLVKTILKFMYMLISVCSVAVAAGEFNFRGGWKFVNQTPVGGSGGILPPKIFLWFSENNKDKIENFRMEPGNWVLT